MDKVEIDTLNGLFRINGTAIKRVSECVVILSGGKSTKVLMTIDGAEVLYNGEAEVKNRSSEKKHVALLRPETKRCICVKCGKEWHFADAKFCGMCGEKLKEASAKGSL